jgi:hypothetical protein
MSYITEQEALDNVTEFASQTASDKARLLAQSEAYLRARNVKEYKDSADVPQPLKLACYEVIKGVLSNELYQGQSQALKRERVKGDTVETEEEFQDGSTAINATEQYINDLIAPYTKQSFAWLHRI